MKALDLFCGLGGWSDGLAAEGFEVLGVEIEPKIAALYKHPVIVADVCDLNPRDFTGYDFIVGSPPCRDFSTIARWTKGRSGPNRTPWKNPPDPIAGLKNVNAFLGFIEKAKPTYWLMENVPGLSDHIKIAPRVKAKLSRTMYRCFWGNFPAFLIPKDLNKQNIMWHTPKLKVPGIKHISSWERAYIPEPVSRALGKAVKEALNEITNSS